MNNQDQPIQYQKGFVEFYKLKFKVNPDVLIPRPETELLVEEVLSSLRDASSKQSITILDLGTGAGSIAISIAKNLGLHLGGVKVIATDISEKALMIAKLNAKYHQVEDTITFVKSDLLSAFSTSKNLAGHPKGGILNKDVLQDIDIIVTNLPYIPSSRIPYLDSSVKDFEPHLALDGGEDGFELYRKLFQQLKNMGWLSSQNSSLTPQGCQPKLKTTTGFNKMLIGEIDYTHGELAVSVAQKYFPETQVEVKKDLAHLQRILSIRFPNLS